MKYSTLLICSIWIHGTLTWAHEQTPQLKKNLPQAERPLCTIMTQAQVSRFERCMNGEVMTGIRSLDPLMVYCTRLLANCRKSDELFELKVSPQEE